MAHYQVIEAEAGGVDRIADFVLVRLKPCAEAVNIHLRNYARAILIKEVG